jgi:hypothetical protein
MQPLPGAYAPGTKEYLPLLESTKCQLAQGKLYNSAPGMVISLSNQAQRHANIPFVCIWPVVVHRVIFSLASPLITPTHFTSEMHA